ncbi:hypothetical protein MNEG_1344 [Monoraphidium neglectum]|uniref:Uncharacterized protein n=1 Tax=Monoraphidium neglectum TaxID=145388 RepID=A0A0D2MVS8_9CHLO|nr:hypothetical protein MNEG_1344 [Monoraphidium neglectum]KIZ06610.1 hypothetical protein MNEG_1344 [Monoraphidium neglectum]|eukprot:XP_013905629.1 hypothetical protein MNEG_1344 [Monoraphidium neglectum]
MEHGEESKETAQPAERENYGWLASSAVPAKKRRLIEGVGDTGVVELQAQLYRTQQHVTQWKEGGLDPSDKHVRRRAGLDVSQLMQRSNDGVAARANADRLALKQTAPDGSERLAESAAALERKAALYGRLARGEAQDEGEAYEVDFVAKGTLDDEERRGAGDWLEERDEARRRRAAGEGGAVDTSAAALGSGGGMMSEDMWRERERRRWEEEEEARQKIERVESERRQAYKETVLGMTAETEAGRERAQEQKQARDAALAAKRQKLKAAFLQQQIAKAAALAAAGKGGTGKAVTAGKGSAKQGSSAAGATGGG